MALLLFLVALTIPSISAVTDGYKGKEAWGYVNVRPDAYMFWWLYYKDDPQGYSNFPLVIWLQGGPGASSTGYGNFMEIGPYDMHMKPRNTTWSSKANILFLDNPVGTGFSYVTNKSALATNNSQIAEDLLTTLTSLLQGIPEFQQTPLYIIGESYGGKMAIDFSVALYKATKAGKIKCNFKGVALGDSWISPVDSVESWGYYLYTMSLISSTDLDQIMEQVKIMKKDMTVKKFSEATGLFNSIQELINNMTNNVNFYNILKSESSAAPSNQTLNKFPVHHKLHNMYRRNVGVYYADPLTSFMNGPVKEKLGVIPKNITWGGQSNDVMEALTEDFMKPVTDSVDALLNETTLSVNVYNGQLDLIVDSLGTMNWVQNLKWPGVKSYLKSPRKVILDEKKVSGAFLQSFKNFSFYWILNAGHMIPSDAGQVALKMLDMIMSK